MDENIITSDVPNSIIDYNEKIDDLIIYGEIIAGGIIELVWIFKIFLVFYIIFSAWGLVRK